MDSRFRGMVLFHSRICSNLRFDYKFEDPRISDSNELERISGQGKRTNKIHSKIGKNIYFFPAYNKSGLQFYYRIISVLK